ncbi:MAG: hypothetical protein JW864_10395 [Spirochaetes bacterium]|nr:hypothetical protein [Spirochaetota bacterium]
MSILKQFITTALLSAAAGMLVGFPVILNENAPLAENLFKSGLAGCLIGITAFICASLIFRIIRSHPFWTFLAVVIIIAAGTGLAGYLSGITKMRHYIAVIAGAEVIGIVLAFLLFRYSNKLNSRLRDAKKKYRVN